MLPPQREPGPEPGHRQGGPRDRPDEHRPAAHAIGEPTPDRHEGELHQRVDRAEQRRDERADAERVARLFRQERQDEPEAEQVEEDGQEDSAEPRGGFHWAGRHYSRAAQPLRSTGVHEGLAVALGAGSAQSHCADDRRTPIAPRRSAARSIASARTASSRMTPLPRDASSRPTSNCGLTSATSSAAVARARARSRASASRGR